MAIVLATILAVAPTLAVPALAQAAAQTPDIPAPWRSVPDLGNLLAQDRVSGPAQAPISVVVWSDPECPYCKQFSGVPDAAIARAKGKANLAIRMLPLPFHGAAAVLGGMAALCVADQGARRPITASWGITLPRPAATDAACPAGGRRWSPWPGRTARAMAPSSTPACAAMTRWAASLPKGTLPSAPPCRAPRPLPCATIPPAKRSWSMARSMAKPWTKRSP
ncbi:DsbA family protein [Novosphingobium pokkalii]|uniref:DsbA family protein n=1 Tax=Novosphingobium pokkalii TaxID=1770194 RepID=UPI003624AFDE